MDVSFTTGLSNLAFVGAFFGAAPLPLELLLPFLTRLDEAGAQIVIPDIAFPPGIRETFTLVLANAFGRTEDTLCINTAP